MPAHLHLQVFRNRARTIRLYKEPVIVSLKLFAAMDVVGNAATLLLLLYASLLGCFPPSSLLNQLFLSYSA